MSDAFAALATVVASKDQVSCALGEETVVLELKSGTYFGLNEVGTRVWDLLQQPRTVGEVTQVLLEEYAVEAQQLEPDLQHLLQELRTAKLIEVRE